MVSIHGPASTRVVNVTTSFGTNDKVISLIWVAAWKMLTIRPVISAAAVSYTHLTPPTSDLV